jgi:hypothetical protein
MPRRRRTLNRSLARRLLDRETARRERLACLGQPDRTTGPYSLDEVMTRLEALSTVPERFYAPLLRYLDSRPLRRAARAARYASQRLSRGWDDRAIWSLDHHICSTLAQQLRALADSPFGWPGEPWESPQHWESDLRKNATLLEQYATIHTLSAHDRFSAITDPRATPEQTTAAIEALHDAESRIIAEAQTALIWVADVLPHLWD